VGERIGARLWDRNMNRETKSKCVCERRRKGEEKHTKGSWGECVREKEQATE